MDSLYATSSRLKTFATLEDASSSSSKRGKQAGTTLTNLSWPLPPSHSVTPTSLAAAGFYFAPQEGAEDNVTCFLCHKSLGGWEAGDTALAEHVAHSVKKPGQVKNACAFALLCSGGDRMRELGFSEEKDLTKLRKDTFGKKADKWWPLEGKKGYPKAAEMVAAGFYRCSAEQGDDMVRCSYCRLELKDWSQNDDPREFHQSASPTCAFFKGSKAVPASVQTQTSRAASADPDGWEELIPAVPPKKKAVAKKKAPTPSRSPSPPLSQAEETPATSLSRSTRASSRTNPLAASTRLTRSTRASVDPTPTNGTSRIIPASAPSMNLATLADEEEEEPSGSKSARTVKENGRVLAAKPKGRSKKKEVIEEVIEDDIEELRDKSDEEMEQVEEPAKEDEEMSFRATTPKQATPIPEKTPTDIAEPMEELLLSKSPTAPPRPTKSPARQAISPPTEALSPAPPVASQPHSQPTQTFSPAKSSAQPFSPPTVPTVSEQQEEAIEEDLAQEAIQNRSPQEDLSEIEEEAEDDEEEPSQPTSSYNTASNSTEPSNPFQTLDSTPAPITQAELGMQLSDWHAGLIAQALEKTQKELEEQLVGYDAKVERGRVRLCEVLGL